MGGKARQPSNPSLGGGRFGQMQPPRGMGQMPQRQQMMSQALMGGGGGGGAPSAWASLPQMQNAAQQQGFGSYSQAPPQQMGGAVSSGPQGNFNAMMGGAMPPAAQLQGIPQAQASQGQMNSMQGAARPTGFNLSRPAGY